MRKFSEGFWWRNLVTGLKLISANHLNSCIFIFSDKYNKDNTDRTDTMTWQKTDNTDGTVSFSGPAVNTEIPATAITTDKKKEGGIMIIGGEMRIEEGREVLAEMMVEKGERGRGCMLLLNQSVMLSQKLRLPQFLFYITLNCGLHSK